MSPPQALVFDLNGTLLDLAALRPSFARLFGTDGPMGEWFARLLHGSLVANQLGSYRPFGEIGLDTLVAMSRARGMEPDLRPMGEVLEAMRRLPAHADVKPALARLRAGGIRLAVLSNGSAAMVVDQLAFTGLEREFEAVFSVETVGLFKPAAAPYLHALEAMGLGPDETMMVAAHDWDVAGADRVGMATAFLARPGVAWGLPGDPPGLVAGDLGVLADRLLLSGMSLP